MKALKISTVPVDEVPVELETAKGEIKNAVLRPLSGGDREYFMNETAKSIQVDENGNPISGTGAALGSLDILLISRALFDPETDLNFPEESIRAFPLPAVDALANAVYEMNGLDKRAREQAKNVSGENDTSGTE